MGRFTTELTIMLVLLVLVAGTILPSQADVENTLGRMQSQADRLERAVAMKTKKVQELEKRIINIEDQQNDMFPWIAFNAYKSEPQEMSRERYEPDQVRFDQSSVNVLPPSIEGEGFNPASGNYTCARTGYYNFYGVITVEWVASARGTLLVYQNDNVLFTAVDISPDLMVFDVNTLCNVGDQISVFIAKTYSGSNLSYGIAKAA